MTEHRAPRGRGIRLPTGRESRAQPSAAQVERSDLGAARGLVAPGSVVREERLSRWRHGRGAAGVAVLLAVLSVAWAGMWAAEEVDAHPEPEPAIMTVTPELKKISDAIRVRDPKPIVQRQPADVTVRLPVEHRKFNSWRLECPVPLPAGAKATGKVRNGQNSFVVPMVPPKKCTLWFQSTGATKSKTIQAGDSLFCEWNAQLVCHFADGHVE